MTTHSRILAWRIPWTEEPGGLWGGAGSVWSDLSEQHVVDEGAQRLVLLEWKVLSDGGSRCHRASSCPIGSGGLFPSGRKVKGQ